MENYRFNQEIPEFSNITEHRAKKIIEELDKKYRKATQLIMSRVSESIDVKVNDYNGRISVQFIFITSGCNMKKKGSCWNCNYGIRDKSNVLPQEYISKFENMLNKYKGDNMILGSLGSITDDKEFSRDIFVRIIDLALERGQFKSILIETHITQIDEDIVRYIANKNSKLSEEKRKTISFEIGVEDFNPDNRKLINKLGVNNQKILDLYKMLKKYNIGLEINLIYGLPFQTENERIISMMDNIKYANENLPDAGITIFLMSIKDNTIMQHMKINGYYELPNPWGFVESIREILQYNGKNHIGFSWFGEKELQNIGETNSYGCPECKELIVNAIKKLNGTSDRNERKEILKELLINAKKLKCKDYENFQKKFESEARNTYKRKTPKRKLYDYYTYLINKQTSTEAKHINET